MGSYYLVIPSLQAWERSSVEPCDKPVFPSLYEEDVEAVDPPDQQVVWIWLDKPRMIHQEIHHNREPWLGRPQWQYQIARSMFHFDFGENSTQDTKRRECIKHNILPIKRKSINCPCLWFRFSGYKAIHLVV